MVEEETAGETGESASCCRQTRQRRLDLSAPEEHSQSLLPSHHDIPGQLSFPQTVLPKEPRLPAETETTHPACQRVQEPHAAGRHQCV